MGRQPDKVRKGTWHAFWNAPITSDYRVTLTNDIVGSTPPYVALTGLCWPTQSTPLGEGKGLKANPQIKTQIEDVDFVGAITNEWIDESQIDFEMDLAFNGYVEVDSLFRLPESTSGYDYFGGRNSTTYKGSLLLLIFNNQHEEGFNANIVKAELYYNCEVIPTAYEYNAGHTYIKAKFKMLAYKDPATGRYVSHTYHRWTTTIIDPNTYVMPSGSAINTDQDVLTPMSDYLWINL